MNGLVGNKYPIKNNIKPFGENKQRIGSHRFEDVMYSRYGLFA